MKKNRTICRTTFLQNLVPQGFNPEATGLTLTPNPVASCSREGIVVYGNPGDLDYSLTNERGNVIEYGRIHFDHTEYKLPKSKKMLMLANGDWALKDTNWYGGFPYFWAGRDMSPEEITVGTVKWDAVEVPGGSITINSECRNLSATEWINDKINSPFYSNGKFNFEKYANNVGLTEDTVVIIRLSLNVDKIESLNKELSSLVKLRNLFLRKTKTVYVVTPLLGSWQSLITRNSKYAQMMRDTFADSTIDVAMLGAPYTTGYSLITPLTVPNTSAVPTLHSGRNFDKDNAAYNLGLSVIRCAAKKVIDSEL